MLPQPNTDFLVFGELDFYQDKSKYFCSAIVFSPETENNHFHNCPPYIAIDYVNGVGEALYFKVPEIIAYYAKTHPGYTMSGLDKQRKEGKRELANQLKSLLNI